MVVGLVSVPAGYGPRMPVIVFDVNETLLDLSELDQPFVEVFGDRAAQIKRLWFARLLHTSVVMTTIGTFQDFGVIGKAVLSDLGRSLEHPVSDADVAGIVGTMRSLSPHPDVVPGLGRLAAAGWRLVALTNSGQDTAEAQLSSAGIADFFDRIIGVDAIRHFKPDRVVYEHCTDELATSTGELVMVAAHDWDCAGAMRVGWRSAFVARPGQTYNPLYQPATWSGPDVDAVATTLLEALA